MFVCLFSWCCLPCYPSPSPPASRAQGDLRLWAKSASASQRPSPQALQEAGGVPEHPAGQLCAVSQVILTQVPPLVHLDPPASVPHSTPAHVGGSKSPGSLRVTELWCSRICPAAAGCWGRVRSSPGGLIFGLNPGCNLLRAVCTLPAMSNSPAVLSAWEGSRQGQPMEENHTHPSRSHVPCSLETDPTRAKPA